VIEEPGVTTLWLTAALFHQMVDTTDREPARCAPIASGEGETLSASHVRRMLEVIGGGRLMATLRSHREHHLYLLSRDEGGHPHRAHRSMAGRSAIRGSTCSIARSRCPWASTVSSTSG